MSGSWSGDVDQFQRPALMYLESPTMKPVIIRRHICMAKVRRIQEPLHPVAASCPGPGP